MVNFDTLEKKLSEIAVQFDDMLYDIKQKLLDRQYSTSEIIDIIEDYRSKVR